MSDPSRSSTAKTAALVAVDSTQAALGMPVPQRTSTLRGMFEAVLSLMEAVTYIDSFQVQSVIFAATHRLLSEIAVAINATDAEPWKADSPELVGEVLGYKALLARAMGRCREHIRGDVLLDSIPTIEVN